MRGDLAWLPNNGPANATADTGTSTASPARGATLLNHACFIWESRQDVDEAFRACSLCRQESVSANQLRGAIPLRRARRDTPAPVERWSARRTNRTTSQT